MIEQGLFKRHFAGRDGFIWWIGQVASEESWKENIPGKPVETNEDIKGFGERYRVRIMGYHTADVSEIPDEDLPWAYVVYPVTAGGGGRNSSQSSNITQGTFVFGFFMDGEDAQTPCILGCIGYNDYAKVMANLSPNAARFVPFTGYTIDDEKRSSFGVREQSGGTILDQQNSSSAGNNNTLTESAQGDTSIKPKADSKERQDGKKKSAITPISECDKTGQGPMQTALQNMIQEINDIQGSVYDFRDQLVLDVKDVQSKIRTTIDKYARIISGFIKNIFTEVEKFVTKTFNDIVQKTYEFLFDNERDLLRAGVETAIDKIACLFKKLIEGLFNMVVGFLTETAPKIINVPSCAINDIIGGMLGFANLDILNTLTGELNSITNLLSSFEIPDIGSMFGGFGALGDMAGFIDEVISFLDCDTPVHCSKLSEWSSWDGFSDDSFGSPEGILNAAKSVQSKVVGSAQNISGSWESFTSDLSTSSSCDKGPRECGPPRVIFKGSGTGAQGNVIVGKSGEVLAIDMISYGQGYGDSIRAYIKDDCGKGDGAIIIPVPGDVNIIDVPPPDDPGGPGTPGGPDGPDGPDGPGIGTTQIIFTPPGTNVVNPLLVTTSLPKLRYGTNGEEIRLKGVIEIIGGTASGGTAPIKNVTFLQRRRRGEEYENIMVSNGKGGKKRYRRKTYRIRKRDNLYQFRAVTVSIDSSDPKKKIRNVSNETPFFILESLTDEPEILNRPEPPVVSIPPTTPPPPFTPEDPTTPSTIPPGQKPPQDTDDDNLQPPPPLPPPFDEPEDDDDFYPEEPPDGGNTPIGPGTPGTGIVDVIIREPGNNYISTPDGSSGGDGRTWQEPNETVIIRDNGDYEHPIPPGFDVDVFPGDTVIIPPGSNVITEPIPGIGDPGGPGTPGIGDPGGNEEIIGGTVHIVTSPGRFTTPPLIRQPISSESGTLPYSDDGSYPVILFLCGMNVIESGTNYSPDDEVIITPDLGAKVSLELNDTGGVVGLKVTERGEGYTSFPRIRIVSETGFNAVIRPKLCIDRIGVDRDTNPDPDQLDKIISVVDCTTRGPVGFLKNKPYYGPYHEHKGTIMVGSKHSNKPHETLSRRPNV